MDLGDNKIHFMAVVLEHSKKNRLLPCQPGKCRANPLFQCGVELICLSQRFLPSRMMGQSGSYSHDGEVLVLPKRVNIYFLQQLYLEIIKNEY